MNVDLIKSAIVFFVVGWMVWRGVQRVPDPIIGVCLRQLGVVPAHPLCRFPLGLSWLIESEETVTEL